MKPNFILTFCLVLACLLFLVGINSIPAYAINPVNAIFVANSQSNTVSIIDTGSSSVIANITGTGAYPRVAILSPGGSKLYVGCYDGSEIDVISLIDLQITKRIAMPGKVIDIVISPDGNYLYAGLSTHAVSKIDLRTNTIIGTTSVGSSNEAVQSLALSDDGGYLWCAGYPDTSIYILYTNTIGTPILAHTITSLPGWPAYIIYAQGQSGLSDMVYADFQGGVNRVIKIDPSDYSIDYNVVTSASSPFTMAYTSGYLYIGTSNGIIQVYDGYNLILQQNITLGTATVQGIALPTWGTTGYATQGTAGTVVLFSTTSPRTVLGSISVGSNPYKVTSGQISPEVATAISPQLVTFTVASSFGLVKYPDVMVTVKNMNDVVIYSQYTGIDATVPFILSPNVQYAVTAENSSKNINKTITLYPVKTAYMIDVGLSPITNFNGLWYSGDINQSYSFTSGTGDPFQDVTATVNQSSRIVPNSRWIRVNYYDATSSTSNLNMSLYKANGSTWDYISSNNSVVSVWSIPNDTQNKNPSSYKVVVKANTNAYGNITRIVYASWDGTGYLLPGLGIDNKALPYEWICFGIVFLIIIIGTFISNGVIIFIAGAAWEIMIALGWMTSSTQNLALGALVMAIGAGYILMQKRREVI